MFDRILELDSALLLFFNHLNNPVLDFLFYWISWKWLWVPFYAFLAWFLYQKKKEHFVILVLMIVVLITLSDQISSSLIKDAVMRLRPCHDPIIASDVRIVNGYCGGKYGFLSSHASNSFALASFIIVLFRNRYAGLKRVLLGWAVIVSFSRVYLGVHYPGDVLAGAVLGSLLGIAMAFTFRYYKVNFAPERKHPPKSSQSTSI